jgi:hypothetical protein
MQAGRGVEAALAEVTTRFELDPQRVRHAWRGAQGSHARWIEWGFFVAADR